MKILEVIPNINKGGAERFVVDLSNELSQTNEVILILLFSPSSCDNYYDEVNQNVRIITLDKKRGFDLTLLFRLYRLIKQEKPDVIHTHIRAFSYIAIL